MNNRLFIVKLKTYFLTIATTLGFYCGIKNTNNDNNFYNIPTYTDEMLSSSSLALIDGVFGNIDQYTVESLLEDITVFSSVYNFYVDDYSVLKEKCPHIKEIMISQCPNISSLDFLYDLSELQYVIIKDTPGVTNELINYFDANNIKYDIDLELVDYNNKLDEIISSIITEDMTEDEKMQSIASFVTEYIKYDISSITSDNLLKEYNSNSIKYALEGKGVCANYAALTSALCAKSGLTSYRMLGNNHAWNMVKIDDKYYYYDLTNLKLLDNFSSLLLEKYNVGFNYKIDPFHTFLTEMVNLSSDEMNVSDKFLDLVIKSEDKKTFIEKYGSNMYSDLVIILGIYSSLSLINLEKEKNKCKVKRC